MKSLYKVFIFVFICIFLTSCGKSGPSDSAEGSIKAAVPSTMKSNIEVFTDQQSATEEQKPETTETEISLTEEKAPETSETGSADSEEQTDGQISESDYIPQMDASGFVILSEAVPDVILEMRYFSTYNFVGTRVDGYEEPIALITKEAALALKEVSDELLPLGYRLKIFDAYRPRKAVNHFVSWSEDENDISMKEYFYPDIDKSLLFDSGYLSYYSGHSRGSTVDLTIFDMNSGKDLDMGGTFDFFGEISHTFYDGITPQQHENRMFLRDIMLSHGFKGLNTEWWHFSLINEPYPDTYFNFPVNSSVIIFNWI